MMQSDDCLMITNQTKLQSQILRQRRTLTGKNSSSKVIGNHKSFQLLALALVFNGCKKERNLIFRKVI